MEQGTGGLTSLSGDAQNVGVFGKVAGWRKEPVLLRLNSRQVAPFDYSGERLSHQGRVASRTASRYQSKPQEGGVRKLIQQPLEAE